MLCIHLGVLFAQGGRNGVAIFHVHAEPVHFSAPAFEVLVAAPLQKLGRNRLGQYLAHSLNLNL